MDIHIYIWIYIYIYMQTKCVYIYICVFWGEQKGIRLLTQSHVSSVKNLVANWFTVCSASIPIVDW